MVGLRCSNCQGYDKVACWCKKKQIPLENGYAMLYHGGAVDNKNVDKMYKPCTDYAPRRKTK